MQILLLRLAGPLMSFGTTRVDQMGSIQEFPGLSLLAGLLGNALGYSHAESDKLESLQACIRYAVRRDRGGARITDYQTVDLGQSFLVDTGWTTLGVMAERKGASGETTHIRFRDYWADAVFTVALTLRPGKASLSLDDLAHALAEPERPIFIGRKPCLPTEPILIGKVDASSLLDALIRAPFSPRHEDGVRIAAWWPEDESVEQACQVLCVTDERDWANQIHVGRRLMRTGFIDLPLEAAHGS